MADILRIARLADGITRNVDISAHTLVVLELKVGGAAGTILTKAIVDTLAGGAAGGVGISDASALHHHDGRYFTESELGSALTASGSDLIGDDATYANFTPAAATVKGALSGIDTRIGTLAANAEFADNVFRIKDDGDATKKIAFEASAIATATTRTVSMPDANVNLVDVNNAILKDGSRAFIAAQSMGGFKLTSLASPTVASDAANKSYVDAIAQGIKWKDSVRAIALSSITLSGAQTIDGVALIAGDRVLVAAQAAPANNGVYVVAAGAWSRSEDANDALEIPQLAVFVQEGTVNADSGWVCSTDGAIVLGTTSLAFVQFTGLGQVTAGLGLGKTGNDIFLQVDNSTIEISSDAARLKADGITNSHINSAAAIAYSKLALTGAILNADLAGSIAYGKLVLSDSIVNADIAAGAAILTSKLADSAAIAEAVTFFNNSDITGAEAQTLSNGGNADDLHSHAVLYRTFTNNSGVTIPAGSVVALSTTNAGGVILANAGAEATCYSIAGVTPTQILNANIGRVQISGVANVTLDGALLLGRRVYASAVAGAATATAPSAVGTVVYLLGGAVSSTEILLNPHLEAVNE